MGEFLCFFLRFENNGKGYSKAECTGLTIQKAIELKKMSNTTLDIPCNISSCCGDFCGRLKDVDTGEIFLMYTECKIKIISVLERILFYRTKAVKNPYVMFRCDAGNRHVIHFFYLLLPYHPKQNNNEKELVLGSKVLPS